MFEDTPKKQGRAIVLVGDLNPKIFQPEWFAVNKLLGREEVDKAEINIVHSDVVDFSTSWLKVQVLRERFRIETTQDMYFEKLRDLATSTFEILCHTPIKKMGLNYQFHFQVDSEDNWNKVGDKLAPKEMWKEVLKNPGLLSLIITEKIEKESCDRFLRIMKVTVQPSSELKYGIFLGFNDHFEFISSQTPPNDVVQGSNDMIELLKNKWSDSELKVDNIVRKIIDRKNYE